jgi:hypothetical protein
VGVKKDLLLVLIASHYPTKYLKKPTPPISMRAGVLDEVILKGSV